MGDWAGRRNVIIGRPDLGPGHDRRFGQTELKKFPPYVYSVGRQGALVHKVLRVTLHWYDVGGHGDHLLRLESPRLVCATTVCGQSKYVAWPMGAPRKNYAKPARMCAVPRPDAVLCGKCHGHEATFGAHGEAARTGLTRHAANLRLGCLMVEDVEK